MTENPPPGWQPPSGAQPPPGSYPPPGGYPSPGGYPPPPGYPGPGEQGAWVESKGKGMAVTALVLGVLALLTCWLVIGGLLFGLFAVIFGAIATVKARRGTAAGGSAALVGLIFGLLSMIAAIVIAVIGVNFFVHHGGRDFVDCVDRAKGDQTKIEQCQHDWNQTLQNHPR